MKKKVVHKTGEDKGEYETGVSASARAEAVTVPQIERIAKQIGKRYVKIFEDPMTQTKFEGMAQVIEYSHLIPVELGYVMVYATVHFKGDAKWARNERKFMIRG